MYVFLFIRPGFSSLVLYKADDDNNIIMVKVWYLPFDPFIPEEVAEASRIFLRDTHILLKWLREGVIGGKYIAVWSQSISAVRALIL
jgi:hypothetical protein